MVGCESPGEGVEAEGFLDRLQENLRRRLQQIPRTGRRRAQGQQGPIHEPAGTAQIVGQGFEPRQPDGAGLAQDVLQPFHDSAVVFLPIGQEPTTHGTVDSRQTLGRRRQKRPELRQGPLGTVFEQVFELVDDQEGRRPVRQTAHGQQMVDEAAGIADLDGLTRVLAFEQIPEQARGQPRLRGMALQGHGSALGPQARHQAAGQERALARARGRV